MPYEIDDQGLRIIGYNEPIRFYDNNRVLQASIFLKPDNTLNVGGTVGGGGGGGTTTIINNAMTPHDIGGALHTGILSPAQAPTFLMLDGSRALSADWDAGSHKITAEQLESDVATGTAPLAIASTTMVSNLNADLLDGYEASALAALAENETITGAWTFNGNIGARHITPNATDTYDLGSSTKLWRKGYLSELEAVLFAENTITLLGGWFYVPKYAGTLTSAVESADTQINFDATTPTLTAGDHIVLRSSGQVEYVTLVSVVLGTLWNVTRNVDGSGANDWPAGTPYVCLGQDGDGRIELNAYDTPRISIIEQGAAYNAQTEIIRMGDLNGGWGYSSELYGIAIGDSGSDHITVEATNGIRFRDSSGNTVGQLNGADWTLGSVSGGEYLALSDSGIELYSNSVKVFDVDNGGDVILGQVAASKANVFFDQSEGRLNFRGNTTTQAYIDTDGSIVGGGGNVKLNSDGLAIISGSSSSSIRAYSFDNSSGTELGGLYSVAFTTPGGSPNPNYLILMTEDITDYSPSIDIQSHAAVGSGEAVTSNISLTSYIGSSTLAGCGITLRMSEATAGGTQSGYVNVWGKGLTVGSTGNSNPSSGYFAAAASTSGWVPFTATEDPISISANGNIFYATVARDMTIDDFIISTKSDDLDASNYWTVKLQKGNAAGTYTDISSFDNDGDTDGTWTRHSDTGMDEDVDSSTYFTLRIRVEKTGSPGDLILATPMVYVW